LPLAYSEEIARRVRQALAHIVDLEEKKMIGGICFMVKGKMCTGVRGEEMMCRIGPDHFEEALQERGCRPMTLNSRIMTGFVIIDKEGMQAKKDFDRWIKRSLDYNKFAKPAKGTKKERSLSHDKYQNNKKIK